MCRTILHDARWMVLCCPTVLAKKKFRYIFVRFSGKNRANRGWGGASVNVTKKKFLQKNRTRGGGAPDFGSFANGISGQPLILEASRNIANAYVMTFYISSLSKKWTPPTPISSSKKILVIDFRKIKAPPPYQNISSPDEVYGWPLAYAHFRFYGHFTDFWCIFGVFLALSKNIRKSPIFWSIITRVCGTPIKSPL